VRTLPAPHARARHPQQQLQPRAAPAGRAPGTRSPRQRRRNAYAARATPAAPNRASASANARRRTGHRSLAHRRTWRVSLSSKQSSGVTNCVVTPEHTALRARFLAHLVGLDHVTHLEVVERPQRETALETVPNLSRVILIALQGVECEVLLDHDIVPQQAGLRVPPHDAFADHATGDGAHLGGLEGLPNLGLAELDLLVLRLEHALEGLLNVLGRAVDHRVVPDLNTLAVGDLRGLTLRSDVEAQHDRVFRSREVDVALGDSADTTVDHAQLDLFADVDLGQRLLARFDRTRVVALDEQVQLVGLLDHLVQVLEAHALPVRSVARFPDPRHPPVSDLPGNPVLLDDHERVTCTGHRGQSDYLHRTRRCGLSDVVLL